MPVYEVAVKQNPVNRGVGTFPPSVSQGVNAHKYIIVYLNLKRSFETSWNTGTGVSFLCYFTWFQFVSCKIKCSEPCHLFFQFLWAEPFRMTHQFGLKHKMRCIHASIGPGLCVLMNIKLIIWVAEVKRNFKCCFNEDRQDHLLIPCAEFKQFISDILHSGARSAAVIMGLSAFPLLTPILQLKISLQDEVLYKAFQLQTKKLSKLILLLLQFKKMKFCCCLLYPVWMSCFQKKKKTHRVKILMFVSCSMNITHGKDKNWKLNAFV